MKRLLIICVLLFGAGAKAQDTIKHFAYGTKGEEEVVDMMLTSDGYAMFGSTGFVGNGQSDIYVLELDTNFALSDAHTIGTEAIERLGAVAYSESLNGYFLVSTTYNGFTTEAYDLRIDLVDDSFGVLKTSIYALVGNQDVIKAACAEDTLFMIYENGDADFRLISVDAELNVIDEVVLPSTDTVEYTDIEVFNNRLYITSNLYSTNTNSYDFRISEFSFDLDSIDQFTYGYLGDDFANDLEFISDSSFLVTGSSNSLYLEDLDVYIGEIDTGYQVLWDTIYGYTTLVDNKDEIGANAIISKEDSIYLGKTTSTFGAGQEDFSLYRLRRDGNFAKSNTYGQEQDEVLSRVFFGHDSVIVLFGTTNSFGAGQKDFLVVTFDRLSRTQNRVFTILEDTLSQPPTNLGHQGGGSTLYDLSVYGRAGQVVIDSDVPVTYQIFDPMGRLIIDGSTQNHEEISLHSGIYLIQCRHVDSDELMEVTKVLVGP